MMSGKRNLILPLDTLILIWMGLDRCLEVLSQDDRKKRFSSISQPACDSKRGEKKLAWHEAISLFKAAGGFNNDWI